MGSVDLGASSMITYGDFCNVNRSRDFVRLSALCIWLLLCTRCLHFYY